MQCMKIGTETSKHQHEHNNNNNNNNNKKNNKKCTQPLKYTEHIWKNRENNKTNIRQAIYNDFYFLPKSENDPMVDTHILV